MNLENGFFNGKMPGARGLVGATFHAIDSAPQTSDDEFTHTAIDAETTRKLTRQNSAHQLGTLALRNEDIIENNRLQSDGYAVNIARHITEGTNAAMMREVDDNTKRLLDRDTSIKDAKFTAGNIFSAGGTVRRTKKALGHNIDAAQINEAKDYPGQFIEDTKKMLQKPDVMELVVEKAREEAEAAGKPINL